MFRVHRRYNFRKHVGTGAYGTVIAVADEETGDQLAIKKVADIFDDLVDAKRILREVRMLKHFHHKNITQLVDLEPPDSKETFKDVYIDGFDGN